VKPAVFSGDNQHRSRNHALGNATAVTSSACATPVTSARKTSSCWKVPRQPPSARRENRHDYQVRAPRGQFGHRCSLNAVYRWSSRESAIRSLDACRLAHVLVQPARSRIRQRRHAPRHVRIHDVTGFNRVLGTFVCVYAVIGVAASLLRAALVLFPSACRAQERTAPSCTARANLVLSQLHFARTSELGRLGGGQDS
jgi:hypothetical protein